MARNYKQPSLVSGMSIDDVMNMDINTFNKLSKSDLRKVVGRLVSAGNKRLRSFEKAGESSPATRHVERSGGKFSTKGKDVNALRAEYSRAKNFLQSKTGTRKGFKKVKRETAEQLKKQGVNVSIDNIDNVMKIYERLKERNPEISAKQLKYGVLTEISNKVNDNAPDFEEIILRMEDELEEIYEQEQELFGGGDNGVSGFFEI